MHERRTLPLIDVDPDLGVLVPEGRFRAPTLRNVALTAPYMHDGSVPTLQAVVEHYASGGKGHLKSAQLKGFAVTAEEVRDLVAFLESLTDRSFVTNPAFGAPR